MTSTTSSHTIAVLRQLFASFGLPDNGPQFTSQEFTAFLRSNTIKHIHCTPYHPASNGAAERFVQSLKQSLRASEKDGLTFPHRLANFLLNYRTTPHATTNVTPSFLLMKWELRTCFNLFQPDHEQKLCDKPVKQALHHDKHSKMRTFG